MTYIHAVLLIIMAGAGAFVLLCDAFDSFFDTYGDDESDWFDL